MPVAANDAPCVEQVLAELGAVGQIDGSCARARELAKPIVATYQPFCF